ncbi:hypothetical protein MTO96_040954 [Rhipicephalus appendiculatus]
MDSTTLRNSLSDVQDRCWSIPIIAACATFLIAAVDSSRGYLYVLYMDTYGISHGTASWPDSISMVTVNLSVKGVIRGIPLEEDAKTINTKIVNDHNLTALAAKRLSNTTTVIIAFESPKVPTLVRSRGRSISTTTTGAPASCQQSRSKSRGSSSAPGPDQAGSRSSRRHESTQEDQALPESVSWADKVKGAPERGVSGETASEPRVTIAVDNEVIAELERENAMLRSSLQQLPQEVC